MIFVRIFLRCWRAEWIRRSHYTSSALQVRVNVTFVLKLFSNCIVLRFYVTKSRGVRDLASARRTASTGCSQVTIDAKLILWYGALLELIFPRTWNSHFQIRHSQNMSIRNSVEIANFIKIPFNVFSHLRLGLPGFLLLWGISAKLL
jgi:hypothetical protein